MIIFYCRSLKNLIREIGEIIKAKIIKENQINKNSPFNKIIYKNKIINSNKILINKRKKEF